MLNNNVLSVGCSAVAEARRWATAKLSMAELVREGRIRGVPTFAKAHFGHPSPSSRQKLNGTD